VIDALFHKWLFANLSNLEWETFLEIPEVTMNNYYYSAILAESLGYSKKLIQEAHKRAAQFCFQKKPATYERYIGLRTLDIQILYEFGPPQRTGIKYSGWKRHQNDHGSLGPQKEDPFPEDLNVVNDKTPLFFEILELLSSESQNKKYRSHSVVSLIGRTS